MKKKIIITVIVLGIIILSIIGFWAFKTGKFAGLADTGPAKINFYTKDASGNAVSSVSIVVSNDNQNYTLIGETDNSGYFGWLDLASQNHTLYFKASKAFHTSSPEYRQISISPGKEYDANFTLSFINQDPSRGKLKGKVTESGTDKPINGAYIYVSNNKTGFSNSQGYYGIADINPGAYTITAFRNEYQRKEIPNITITAGQETTLNIILDKESSLPTPSRSSSASPSPPPAETFSLVAEIVDGETGQKIKDAEVSITPELKPDGGTSAKSRDKAIDTSKYGEANVKVDNIYYPGPTSCISTTYKYQLRIAHPNFETYARTFECKGNVIGYDGENLYKKGQITLTNQIAWNNFIRGHVVDSESNPIIGARIKLIIGDSVETYREISDSEGKFMFYESYGFDPSMQYKIVILHPQYENYTLVLPGSDDFWKQEDILIQLRKADTGLLEGTVTDSQTGLPINSAPVLFMLDGETIGGTSIKTDNKGHYQVELVAGSYTVFVHHVLYYDDQKALKNIKIESGKKYTLDFALDLIKEISTFDLYVRLVDSNGAPFNIPDEITLEEIDLYVNNYPYYNGHLEIQELKGQKYFVFRGVPCLGNGELLIKGDITHDFIVDGKKIPYLSGEKREREICPQKTLLIDLPLKVPEPYINDFSKPDIVGGISLEKMCGDGIHLLHDTNFSKITINLEDMNGAIVRTTELKNQGFAFIDVEQGKYRVSFTTNNLTGSSELFEVKNQTISVEIRARILNEETYIKHFESNGVNLYFIGEEAQETFGGPNWDMIAQDYLLLTQNVKLDFEPKNIPIYFQLLYSNKEDGIPNGPYYASERYPCLITGLDAPYISFGWPFSFDILAHEYGHHAFHEAFIGTTIWSNIFRSAKETSDKDCIFSLVKDGNINLSFSGGHPEDNSSEYFASFFVAYFQHHERLLALIRSLPEGSDCRNILEFAWQFFSEKVAKTPGESIDTASLASNSIRLYKNDKEIFGPVVGGKIGNTIYTPEQIKKGLWKQSVYKDAPIGQKISVRYRQTVSNIYKTLNINPERTRVRINLSVAKFNQFINSLYKGGDRGSIEGVVKEQNGGPKIPKKNVIVIIGKKMAVTDKDGKFKIEKIKTGEQNVRMIDGTTTKNLNIDLETVNIKKDKTIKRYFTVD